MTHQMADMASGDNTSPTDAITHPVSTNSVTDPSTTTKRRVSIANTPPNSGAEMSGHAHLSVPQPNTGGGGGSPGGYDNHGFESPRRRVSVPNDHTEVGPVRKKSILHNNEEHYLDHEKHQNGDARSKKQSVSESVYSKTSRAKTYSECDDEKSWWYTFCLNCRQNDTAPSWSPPGWEAVFPHPFCPSYRQFARILALFLIGFLIWVMAFALGGETAAPGGSLFGLAALCIAAHFGGWLVALARLPALVGMLLTGLAFQNFGLVNFEDEFKEVTGHLRKIALVIILTRAGLELDPEALKRLKFTCARLGLVPWFVEASVVAVSTHFLMDLDWAWGFLLGSIIAAVSPAVVVPCLFRLRSKGYGVAKGIPTLIIAVAGIDDAASVAVFGIISSIMFSSDSLAYQIAQGPLSIVGGLGFGFIWGWLAQYVPEKDDAFVVPLRILMLLGGGLVAVFGSEMLKYDGAGPLGCIAAAFMCSFFWSKQGWEIDENPAATAFQIFWMIFEPILFGITGAQIKINELDPEMVYVGIGCLLCGIILRILVTILVGIGCNLNMKEKVFVALSWMAKATVQAALAPVALHNVSDDDPKQKRFAEMVLMICILSILLTAPIGAIIITVSGPRLLKKFKSPPPVTEGWRRSHRPSIRDISIINEEEEIPEKIINRL